MASASVAQVHLARLPDGRDVPVKILRPDMRDVIDHDIAAARHLAGLVEKVWSDGKRLKPREVVAEFAKYLRDELDLMREASNCSQLRRNFEGSTLLVVPEVHWDWCTPSVMVMERMRGIPISQRTRLSPPASTSRRCRVPASRSSSRRSSATVSSTPTCTRQHLRRHRRRETWPLHRARLRHRRHADRHRQELPGAEFPRLLPARLQARRPGPSRPAGRPPTRARTKFEAAIRAVCEPIFDRPLKEISFGKVLLRLFQTSRRFNVEIQPQLVMLQKTLLNIEGLGRQLDPDLDLWKPPKPFLERWMSEQVGLRGRKKAIELEARELGAHLPQLPRLVHQALILSRRRRPTCLPSSPRSPPASAAGRTPCWHSSPPCSPAFSSHRSSSDFAFREVAARRRLCYLRRHTI